MSFGFIGFPQCLQTRSFPVSGRSFILSHFGQLKADTTMPLSVRDFLRSAKSSPLICMAGVCDIASSKTSMAQSWHNFLPAYWGNLFVYQTGVTP